MILDLYCLVCLCEGSIVVGPRNDLIQKGVDKTYNVHDYEHATCNGTIGCRPI